MGIESVIAHKVTCQQCGVTLTVIGSWQEVSKHGWTAPSDGQLQLCPKCTNFQKKEMLALVWWNKWSSEIQGAYHRYLHFTQNRDAEQAKASYKNYTLAILQAAEDLNLKES